MFAVAAAEPRECPMSRPTTGRWICFRSALLIVLLLPLGCSDSRLADGTAGAAAEEEDPWLRLKRVATWTGDLDGMAERGFLRLLTVRSPTYYFVDGARERGLIAEFAPALESFLNRRLEPEGGRIRVIIIPVRRDLLLPALVEGLGDVAAANITVTEERSKLVDFTAPTFTDARELVVTGPAGPALSGLEDLSGQAVWVRESSSYNESLRALNSSLKAAGLEEIDIRSADENLEDEDLLEMVNAGLLPATVMDAHKLDALWVRIFEDIVVHREIPLTDRGRIAAAIRKDSPLLGQALNEFLETRNLGSEFANVLVNRYMRSDRWIRNATATSERRKYEAVADLFVTYGEQYALDPLMLIAQGYQESGLDQSTRSPAGAVGVMQLLPSTAAAPPVSIANIDEAEANIHAGIKYLRHIVDEYFDDPGIDPVNRLLFAFAAYNVGPNRMARLRELAPQYDADPTEWFGEVERVVESRVGMEPVTYVANIYKYYLAYKQLQERAVERDSAAADLEMKPDS